MEAHIHIHIHGLENLGQGSPAILSELREFIAQVYPKLDYIISQGEQIMADTAAIEAALVKIDTATTEQGVVLLAQGATLQTISDEIDALIVAAQNGTITPAQLARLQALADSAATVSTNLAAQAEFSKLIAAKGAANPVPGPVPVPVPVDPIFAKRG